MIVLRETRLPLAIGLFGNWGSGKSHFMNLMDRHIKMLAPPPPKSGSSQSLLSQEKWCQNVVPIYFNAWHYSDANLWASLVTEIFDKLFEHIRPKDKEFEVLQAQLKEAGGVTALAREELRNAEAEVRLARGALKSAEDQGTTAKQKLKSAIEGFRAALPDLASSDTEELSDLLGKPAAEATLEDVRKKRQELSSTLGSARELWRRATAPQGMTRRFTWLVGMLAAVLLMRFLLPMLIHASWFHNALGHLSMWVKAVILAVSAFLGWLTPAMRWIRNRLKELEAWQNKAEHASNNDPQILTLKGTIAQAEADAATAQATLERAEAREKLLASALNEMRPERQLISYIEARAKSSDYRGQLGLVSLARRDFQTLSDIFTDAEALSARIANSPDQADDLKGLHLSVNRVVLFIDDLDRCQPENVVDVLQAVHLLLAYPLFAVVVGVDQRCLKQSLRIRFKGLLTPPDEHGAGEGNRIRADELVATPLDYLEKIFHIPVHLPAMTPVGFEQLISKLTEPPNESGLNETEIPNVDLSFGPKLAVQSPSSGQEESPVQPAPAVEEMALSSPKPPPAESPAAVDTQPHVQLVGSVPLHSWEREALQNYSALIQTPRGATRFLNTYRLVRAGLSDAEWDSFRKQPGGRQEFQIAMLLLSVAAGQPSVAREWFRHLRSLKPSDTVSASSKLGEGNRSWAAFCDLYNHLVADAGEQFTSSLLEKWLKRVECFTF
ncbi:P-loop NTPase fold protein [Occallatibacter riparius]|uniref:P-loop NTPase fold protein n=1 Tax=Occallatibacter riparius TaxID=1002689 RepID=A0A9J7BWV9_9BACT|nr:P-loop NTPase fold protein [Occallatibacter riparius]UWZ86977.1 P-loop NTPase fold protein [Occallatibacter riparius]